MHAVMQVGHDNRCQTQAGNRDLHRKQNLILRIAEARHNEHDRCHNIIDRRGRPDAPLVHFPSLLLRETLKKLI